jgi:hypothetical protein
MVLQVLAHHLEEVVQVLVEEVIVILEQEVTE